MRIGKRKISQKKELILSPDKYNLLSIVNLPAESVQALQACGINYVFLNVSGGYIEYYLPAIEAIVRYERNLRNLTFSQLISDENVARLLHLYSDLYKELSRFSFDAVLVRTSELFFEKILIDIFKSFNKPSFTLLHGLPGVYTQATESRSDYLLVWGDMIRNSFVDAKYDPRHVLVAGNYKYNSLLQVPSELRCSTEDVLVLTTATFADGQHEWTYDKFARHDRSLLISYIYSIEHVLKQNGVSHARLRPHPHVNKEWLKEYIDLDFYSLDYDDMLSSLQHSTMCIGPTSSTLLESIMSGVSYLVYEPGDGIRTIMGSRLVFPFNKEYADLKKAYSEEELGELIKSHYRPNANKLLNDFMQPFNAQVIKQILDEQKA